MKTGIELLGNFIRDFSLEDADEIVSFNARIRFTSNFFSGTTDSTIQVITIRATGLSVFYFLNPEIAQNQIPDCIPYDEQLFFYSKNESLVIKGSNSLSGFYILKIYPVKK